MDDPLAICIELQVSVYIEWTPVHSRPLVLNFKMNLLKKEKLWKEKLKQQKKNYPA